jgi:hypothetical protein
MSKKDPTAPVRQPITPKTIKMLIIAQAKLHGNQPSKGAQVDAELQADDEQRLREKQGK